MLPVASRFDVYVLILGSEAARRETLPRLAAVCALDAEHKAQLLRGERALIHSNLSDGEAQRIASSVRALGVRVDLEAHRGGTDMVDLADVSRDEPAPSFAPVENPFFDVNAGLVGLDGAELDAAPPVSAPASASPAFGGLFGSMSLRDADEQLAGEEPEAPRAGAPSVAARATSAAPLPARPVAAPPLPVAAPPLPVAAPPLRVAAPPLPVAAPAPRPAPPSAIPSAAIDPRFRPSGAQSISSEIQVDMPVATSSRATPAPSAAEDTVEVPRCPRHDVPRVGSRCPICEEEERVLRGRLLGGKLRNQPLLRVGVGLAAGLFVGWMITTPMARRAERQVDFIREEARRERTRPLDEAQANAAALEAKADDEAQGAFMRTLGIWGAITAAITAVWFRLT